MRNRPCSEAAAPIGGLDVLLASCRDDAGTSQPTGDLKHRSSLGEDHKHPKDQDLAGTWIQCGSIHALAQSVMSMLRGFAMWLTQSTGVQSALWRTNFISVGK